MRKYKYIEILKSEESSIFCNKCGKEFNLDQLALEEWQAAFIHALSFQFGYGSKHDGEIWNLDLCEDCIDEVCKKFVIPVEVKRVF